MLLARTHAAAISNAPAGLFGADVVCGDPSRTGHRRMQPSSAEPQGSRLPIAQPELAATPEPAAAKSTVRTVSTGGSARLWAAYAMGRALSA